ncbi:sugar phosphate isomerase/epimerase family protein [Planctomycetota bacterium]
MNRQTSRRAFLARAPLVTIGSFMAVLGEQKASATESIQRRHGSKYKFTLAAYSYRELLTGNQPECTLKDFMDDCAKFGLEGTELTSYYFPQPITNEYLCDSKAHAFRLGLAISSTAVGNNFSRPVGPEREREIAQVKKWIDHAHTLGAPIVRIFSGNVNKEQTPEEAHRLVVEAIEECCRHAAQKGVFLGLENHGGLTSTADGMLAIIRDVKSPWFGAWMDTGNFHDEDVYDELEKIAPYTLHVQVKVVTSSRGRGREPTDFTRLSKILGAVGYRGWICLEYEEKEDPRIACPRYIEQLRKAFVA